MSYYNKIKNKLIDNEVYSKVKDYSKERHKFLPYFEIGKLLVEAGGKYGGNIIEEYSKKLVVEVGKKVRNINKKLGVTMPEDLSIPEKSQELEKETNILKELINM